MFLLFLLSSFSFQPDTTHLAAATALCQSAIIVDGHIDTPSLIESNRETDMITGRNCSDFSIPLARKGGLDAPFMSIYTPSGLQKTPGASFQHANLLIRLVDSVITRNPGVVAKALSPADIRSNTANGLISLPLGMENGSPIEGNPENVEYFYKKGVRYITLTHATHNQIGGSSYDTSPTGRDLTEFGRTVISEMNRLGILVDLAHVTDSTFYQALRETKAPPVISHSSCRHFTPGFERNVSDDMLKALARKDGIIMINFGTYFLTRAGNSYGDRRREHLDRFIKENAITKRDDPAVKAERTRWEKENPYPRATISDVADHIDHAVRLAGIDHVGLGSDYDGVGPTLPAGLETAATYPNLVAELMRRGYSETDIRKILGENFLRVWETALSVVTP
ncbi:MAG: membrane dipeptidase [Bacteroidetes bacterium]|nr:membrane dipeptidase [Bacteroidota bacterium]